MKLVIAVCDSDNLVESSEETFIILGFIVASQPVQNTELNNAWSFFFSLTAWNVPALLEKKHQNLLCFWKVNCDSLIWEWIVFFMFWFVLYIHVQEFACSEDVNFSDLN